MVQESQFCNQPIPITNMVIPSAGESPSVGPRHPSVLAPPETPLHSSFHCQQHHHGCFILQVHLDRNTGIGFLPVLPQLLD